MGTIHQVLTADESKALDAYRRMDAAQQKMLDRFAQQKQGSDKAGASIEGQIAPLNKVLGLLGLGGGIAGALSMVNRYFEQTAAHAARLSENVKTASADLAAFTMMQEPGQIGARTKETMAALAPYGFSPSEALQTTQMLQAQLGDYQKALAASQAVGQLKLAGVPVQAGQTAVTVGMATGLTAEQAAAAPYAAGEVSSLTPAMLAEASGVAVPAFRGYKGGAVTAYQAMAVLSRFIKEPGMLGTYARIAARTPLDQNVMKTVGATDTSDFWGVYESMVKKGISTPQQLEGVGITEEREKQAWSMLLSDPAAARRAIADVQSKYETPGLIIGKRTMAEREVPEMKLEREIAETQSRIKMAQTVGPEVQQAQMKKLWATQLGETMTERGFGYATDETGMMTMGGRYKAGVMKRLSPYELAGPSDLKAPFTEWLGRLQLDIMDALQNRPIRSWGAGSGIPGDPAAPRQNAEPQPVIVVDDGRTPRVQSDRTAGSP